ncbi:MAG TPA: class I SAM-dependent methyltransferase [Solirubrobacteraceae bacterium]
MPDSAAPQQVRSRFRQKAQQFDDLYDDQRLTTRTLRAGLFRRRQLAIDTVRAYGQPRVLDVGCGSGRIGELAIETGASKYLGVDFSETMIELAQARLERFGPRAKLLIADFLTAPIDGPFDVILALGLFDYTPEPHRFSARMSELCAEGGCVVGSFPAWSLVKGPIRKVRYELIGKCPIVNYTRRELELMFGASGFARVEIASPGRSGFLVRAYREP